MLINAMGMTSHCCAFNTLLLFDLIAATLWFITKFYGKLKEANESLLCVGQRGCQCLSGLPEMEFAEKKSFYSATFSLENSLGNAVAKHLQSVINSSKKSQLLGKCHYKTDFFLSLSFLCFWSLKFLLKQKAICHPWIHSMEFTAPISARLSSHFPLGL